MLYLNGKLSPRASFRPLTPKTSEQVIGSLLPTNWKFHRYIGVVMSRFVLITRSILDLTTCAIPLCIALTKGFISSMTPKTSDQVMGTLWPKNKNWIFFSLEKIHFSFIRPKLDFFFFVVVTSSSLRRRCVVVVSSSHRRRVVVASSSCRCVVVVASPSRRCCIVVALSLWRLFLSS